MVTTRGREIAALLAIREREGLTYDELSERTGLARATLSWWSWRLRREREETPELLAVDVVEEAKTGDSGVSIDVGDGVAVRVGVGFDETTLDRVIGVLSRRC